MDRTLGSAGDGAQLATPRLLYRIARVARVARVAPFLYPFPDASMFSRYTRRQDLGSKCIVQSAESGDGPDCSVGRHGTSPDPSRPVQIGVRRIVRELADFLNIFNCSHMRSWGSY